MRRPLDGAGTVHENQGSMYVMGIMSRERKILKTGVLLLAAVLLCVPGVMNRRAGEVAASNMTDSKKIAITFDDDVIIGLSQEISYKEAVSMI